MGFENMTAGIARDRVEHIFDVEKKESTSRGSRVGEEGFNLGHGKVDDEVHTTRNIDAVLAGGSKELDNSRRHDSHAKTGGNAAEGSAHANGTEFVKVGCVFVEGNEVLSGKMGLNGSRYIVVGDVAKEGFKRGKEGSIAGAGRGVQSELAKKVKRGGKRARSGATAQLLKGAEEVGCVEKEGWASGRRRVACGWTGWAAKGDARWVKSLDDRETFRRNGCDGMD